MNRAWIPNTWITYGGVVMDERQIRHAGTEQQLVALIATTQIIVRLMTCN